MSGSTTPAAGAQVTAEQVMQELVAMRTELARQREENTRLKVEQGAALEAVRTESAARVAEMQAQAQQAVQQATAQMGTMPQLLTEMVRSNKELVEAMAKKESPGEKLHLVDNKGLGKPTTFSGEHEQFLPWRHRMASYVCSIHQDLQEVLEWLEEREKPFSSEELDAAFGERAPDADRVPRLQEKSRELANALQMVTSKEPFTIVCNCQNNGFEAWRRLTRRYDPATASRKRTMLRAIFSPQKQKLENLPAAIEEWADAVRTYEKRKDSMGRRTTIADEIKMAALEAMLPQELEAHIQLNQSRFTSYDDVLDEVTRFIEYKTGKSLKVISAAAASAASKDDPMDLSYFERQHKGQGKGDKTCNVCGKTGHFARDCWHGASKGTQKGSPKGPGQQQQQQQKGKEKGKEKGKGKGKSKSKDEDEEELWALEELFDQAREQLQDLRVRMQTAKERRDARAEEEQLAEARRRSRQEVPGESSFGAFSSSSRGPLEREREPKAGSKKKEGKKEEKKEVKEDRSRAFS